MRVKLYFIKITTIALLTGCYGCNSASPPVIEPIDAELNSRLITGKNLEPGLFSTTDVVQYYEIDHANKSAKQLATYLQEFANNKYPLAGLARRNSFTVYFYQKKLFVNYDSHLYEYARDNENGKIDGHNNDLKAMLNYYKFSARPNELVRHTSVYNKGVNQLTVIDTLPLNK